MKLLVIIVSAVVTMLALAVITAFLLFLQDDFNFYDDEIRKTKNNNQNQ